MYSILHKMLIDFRIKKNARQSEAIKAQKKQVSTLARLNLFGWRRFRSVFLDHVSDDRMRFYPNMLWRLVPDVVESTFQFYELLHQFAKDTKHLTLELGNLGD